MLVNQVTTFGYVSNPDSVDEILLLTDRPPLTGAAVVYLGRTCRDNLSFTHTYFNTAFHPNC